MTKFIIEFPYKEYEKEMWNDVTLGYWQDGDSIPCSFWDTTGDVTENDDFQCVME